MSIEKLPSEDNKAFRVALTVPPDVYATLSEYSEAMGKPMSKIIVELLVDFHPTLKKSLRVARSIAGYQASFKSLFSAKVDKQISELEGKAHG